MNIAQTVIDMLFPQRAKNAKEADTYNLVTQARQLAAMGQIKDDPNQTNKDYVYKGLISQTPSPTITPTATPIPTAIPTPTPPPDNSALAYYLTINDAAKKNNIPQDILYRVLKKESMNFNPDVVSGKINSPTGAQGIAQFMPTTSEEMGFNPLNPEIAINKSAEYLAAKKKQHGTWEKALAAYNAGSGAVEQYKGVPPFKKTIDYVKSILQNLNLK